MDAGPIPPAPAAGGFARVTDLLTGREVIDPGSFSLVSPLMEVFASIPKGFQTAGLIPALLRQVSRRFSARGIVVVPLLAFVISLLDCFLGMPELSVVCIPIILPLMLGLGFGTITACALFDQAKHSCIRRQSRRRRAVRGRGAGL